MTVSSQTSRIEYLGDGSTTAFAVNFYFLENSDLKVFVDGVLQTITTNYTVTGAGNPAGGTVTFVTAPANGVEVVIFRDPALTQGLDYIDNDPFPAESHERGLDKLTMIAQRVKDLVSRALRLGDSVVGVSTELPALTGSQLLGTNPGGTGFQLYPLGSEPDTAGNIVYTPAGTGAVATTVEKQFNNREVSVFRFFTDAEIADVKSGVPSIDVSGKIIQAANYAVSVDSELVFPDGNYFWNTNHSVAYQKMRWKGSGNVRITFGDVAFISQVPFIGTTTVAVDAPLGSLSIQVADASLIPINGPIRLFNETAGDTAFSYDKQGIYYVIDKSGNTIFLDRPTRFSFGAAELGNIVQILDPDSYVSVKNIEAFKQTASDQLSAMIFSSYARMDFNNVDSIGVGLAAFVIRINLSAKITINKTYTESAIYPWLIGGCTDIKVNDIVGRNVHHAIDFASFCDNAIVNGFDIQSVNGGINSHPSFNIWYMNGQTSDYNSPSNHRVLGGGLKNVRMTMGPNCAPQMLFQQPFLVDTSIYSRVKELGLAFEYDNITIIDQRSGDTGFFPARGSGSMKNINSNKSIGFGDDVIECQTENITTRTFWRNRRTYKVFANSTVIRASENAGVFSVNLKSPNLEIDNFVARCHGDLFINKAGEPYNFTIKIFDGWSEDLFVASLVFKLKIKAQVRHSNAGQFDYLEKEYEFFHSIPAVSSVNFPLTAIYTSGLSGVANESLAFTLSNPQQSGRTQSLNSADWFVSIDVSMSSGRTNPFYSAQYELEVRKVN